MLYPTQISYDIHYSNPGETDLEEVKMVNEYGHSKVFNTLRRINLISKFFLASPFTMKRDYTLVESKWLHWFGFVVLLVIISAEIGMQLFLIPVLWNNPYKILAFMKTATHSSFILTCIIEKKSKVEHIQQIFKEIKALENVVQLTSKEENEYSSKANRMVITFLTMMTFLNINIILRFAYSWWINILLVIHVNLLFSAPYLMEIQFASLINLVESYIDWIHDNLKLASPKTNKFSPGRLFEIKRSISHTEKWEVEKLQKLRYLNGQINDLKDRINQAFSFRLWFFIFEVFVQFVFVIFLLILQLQLSNTQKTNLGSPKLLWQYLWLTYTFYTFIEIVHFCDSVEDKGKRTGTVLHQLLFASSEGNIRDEISLFSLELLHRNPSITAYKFFNVNYSLFTSVLASCVMYIIILLQFKFPEYDGVTPIEDLIERS